MTEKCYLVRGVLFSGLSQSKLTTDFFYMLYVYVIKGTGPFLMEKFSILHPYKSPFPQLSMNKLLSKNNNQKH